jgi:hypothetical protein
LQTWLWSAISGLSDGPSDSIAARIRLCILPPARGMTLLVSDLAFATRAMRSLLNRMAHSVCLSICVQRAAAQDTPALRTHALLPKIRCAPLQGADSCPKASLGPLPQILSSRRGSGSRRHTLRAMYGPPPDCKRKVLMMRSGLRQCIRPVNEAIASGHDVLRAPPYLSSMSASSALPKDRLRAGQG